MTFKINLQIIFSSLLILIMGCIYPTNEWEDLESDFSHVLNVFGLINLDPGYPSYVGLYRTTDLDETSMNFVSGQRRYRKFFPMFWVIFLPAKSKA